MQRYTILIIPDHRAQVRRIQIAASRVRRIVWGAAIGAALLAAASVDYVRARLDTRELGDLRAETLGQREQLGQMEQSLDDLDRRLARLRELERKVRVIADLPLAGGEAAAARPAMGGGLEATESRGPDAAPEGVALDGEGGDAEDETASLPGEGAAVAAPPERSAALRPVPASPLAVRAARLHEEARRMSALTQQQEVTLAELVDRLEGKRHRLASTPSVWPARGWVTSGFGYRVSPFTGRRQFHGGIDIAAQAGTVVVAPARGRVVFVGHKGPLGKSLVIDHGYGVRTTYGHTQAIHVTQGQVLERGEKIASLGSSGRSTGPHLHYAVHVNGRAMNPFNYILE